MLVVEVFAVALGTHMGWIGPLQAPEETKALLLAAFIGVTVFIARVYDHERQRFEARLSTLTRELYEASVRDPLTLVFNRRHFAERLAAELSYARRHATSLSMLIMDVDHFKRVNDTFGHQAGDTVLVGIAALVQEEIRQEDVLARYGGEEFGNSH